MDTTEEKGLLKTEKPRNFEDVIVSSIGEFGRSQLIIVLACKLPMFIGAWSMIMMSFAGTEPDWWLQTKTNYKNGKPELLYLFLYSFSSCEYIYKYNLRNLGFLWGLLLGKKIKI